MKLLKYLKLYRKWLDEGAPEGQPFTRRRGLCFQWYDTGVSGIADHRDLTTYEQRNALDVALSNALRSTTTDVNYPFGGKDLFYRQQRAMTSHQNKARRDWVDAQIKRLSRRVPPMIGFLRHWLAWADGGAPNGSPYMRYTGLCGSASAYAVHVKGKGQAYTDTILNALERQFDADGLTEQSEFGCRYPFGAEAYKEGWRDQTQYRDVNRLAWVRRTLRAWEYP